MKSSRRCLYCKDDVSADARFCPSCGKKQSLQDVNNNELENKLSAEKYQVERPAKEPTRVVKPSSEARWAVHETTLKTGNKQPVWKRWGWVPGRVIVMILRIGLLLTLVSCGALKGIKQMHTIVPTPTIIIQTWFRPVDGITMVYIPAGKFSMGSPVGVGYEDEQPQHDVYLDDYWIDRNEVTNDKYRLCVQSGACEPPRNTEDYFDRSFKDHPVIYVSWYDAQDYCSWAGAKLPTEAEWEKAARGGLEGKLYPWGDYAPTCDKGMVNGAQYSTCVGETVPVRSFATNGYGLYDMAGNVWEWVTDWYSENYYEQTSERNPQGPATGDYRILRGGSWYSFDVLQVRAAVRIWVDPSLTSYHIGFRCSRVTLIKPSPVQPIATNLPTGSPLRIGSTWARRADGMTMMFIPAGGFNMGSPDGVGYNDEHPQHRVYLNAYWIDQTEVTNAMYRLCVQAFICHPPDNTRYYSYGMYRDYPVLYVSWYDAKAYCEWAGGRLPTEAEWEKAARGGLEGKLYPWGDTSPTCDRGTANGAQYYGCSGGVVPVSSFAANGYGLYDMAGNVWEWVSSLYKPYPYQADDEREDLSASGYRALRGGSWFISEDNVGTADRNRLDPEYSNIFVGFRCSRGTSP